MRLQSLIVVTSAVFMGCAPRNVPMPIAPGAKFAVFATTTAIDPNATEVTDPASGGTIYLQTPPIVSTIDVASVTQVETNSPMAAGPRSSGRQLAITVELTKAGEIKIAAATATANGSKVAIVVNDEVVAVPTLVSPIRSSFQIVSDNARIDAAFDALTTRKLE